MTTTHNAGSAAPITAAAVRELIAGLLQDGRSVRFEARGDSMHPVIRSGDHLCVEPGNDVGIGDIVLTSADRGLTAHRVLSRIDDVIVTRGDNSGSVDLPLHVSRVLGRVAWVERGGRRLAVPTVSRASVLLRRCIRTARRSAGRLGLKQFVPQRLRAITSV